MISLEDAVVSQLDFKKDSFKASPLKATQVLFNRIDKMDAVVRGAVRDFLGSSSKQQGKYIKLEDFMSLSNSLNVVGGPDDTLLLFEDFAEAGELNLAYQEKLDTIRDNKPINQSITLFGVDERPPSTYEQKKWTRAVRLFKDPMLFFSFLNEGILTAEDVDTLGIFYPSILESAQKHMVEGIVDLKAKGVDGLGLAKMKLVNKVLQVPRLTPQQLSLLQDQYSSEEAGGTSDVDIKNVQTETQRIESRKG